MSRFELEHINTLWFMTLGVTAISAGVLVYVLLLESALGAFSIKEFYPAISARDEGPRIAILDSDFTRNLGNVTSDVPRDSMWYNYLLTSWKSYVDSSIYHISTDFIDDATLEEGDLYEKYNVLVLPAAHALSEKQIDQLFAFMEDGGSIYASWKTGYYRPNGNIRGWSVVETLFGVEHVEDVDRNEGTYRAYQAIYPGEVEPGMYVPVSNVISGIEENNFKPLAGYRWIAPLSEAPPRADHAQADTSTIMLRDESGDIRPQKGVTINYYSWLGDDSGRKVPYTYVGFGMESISFLGNTPLTLNMPAGYSLFIQVYDPAVRMKVAREETRSIAYWTDWVRSFDESAVEDHSSIVYGSYLNGRFVYTGFRRDALGVGYTDQQDIVLIDRFFKNVFNYLRKTPTVWLRDWPAPYDGGAMLSGLAGANLENLIPLADSLEQEGVRGTFFIEPTQADLHRSTVVSLNERGEIGVLDDYSDRSFDAITDQKQRFENLREVLEELIDTDVKTYRSSQLGQVKMETQQALAKAGFTSVFSDSLERRSLPIVSRFTTPRLTRYTITSWTDEEMIAANSSGNIQFWTHRK